MFDVSHGFSFFISLSTLNKFHSTVFCEDSQRGDKTTTAKPLLLLTTGCQHSKEYQTTFNLQLKISDKNHFPRKNLPCKNLQNAKSTRHTPSNTQDP
jgi:hypothetical protein